VTISICSANRIPVLDCVGSCAVMTKPLFWTQPGHHIQCRTEEPQARRPQSRLPRQFRSSFRDPSQSRAAPNLERNRRFIGTSARLLLPFCHEGSPPNRDLSRAQFAPSFKLEERAHGVRAATKSHPRLARSSPPASASKVPLDRKADRARRRQNQRSRPPQADFQAADISMHRWSRRGSLVPA
jgi:hypothetical protein